MTEPVAVASSAAELAPSNAPGSQPAGQLDPAETRMFANMMQGMPAAAPPGTAGSSLRDAAMAYAAQLSGNVRSVEDMRRSMLESVDLSDPIKTMFALTDHSMEAHTMFAKLHISTGLASAATSLFSTLLKNQQ
jgi:hypothetical protein